MADFTVFTDIDTFLQSADNATARTNLGIPVTPAINLGTPLVELKLLAGGPDTTNTSTPTGFFSTADVRGVHTPVEVTDTDGLWDAAAHTFTPAEDGTYLFRWDHINIYFGANAAVFAHGYPELGVSIDGVDYLNLPSNVANAGSTTNSVVADPNTPSTISSTTGKQEMIVNLTAGEVVQIISYCSDMFIQYAPYAPTGVANRRAHGGPLDAPLKIHKL